MRECTASDRKTLSFFVVINLASPTAAALAQIFTNESDGSRIYVLFLSTVQSDIVLI
jgi:hypothetical protein